MVTLERLQQLLSYNPATGEWTWLVPRGGFALKAKRAGTDNPTPRRGVNYRRIMIDGHYYREHRLAFFYMTGQWPSRVVDHINRDSCDNRWANLRECTDSQNLANAKLYSFNKSGYRGVSWNTYMQQWQAGIKVNGKSTGLGYFKYKEDAALAYNFAAWDAFGEFAHLNRGV